MVKEYSPFTPGRPVPIEPRFREGGRSEAQKSPPDMAKHSDDRRRRSHSYGEEEGASRAIDGGNFQAAVDHTCEIWVEFFVGRAKELNHIIDASEKACALNTVESLFLFGERGIGKSSLCHVAARAAEKKNKVLGLHVYLGGVTTLEEMARRVFERLLQDSQDKPWFESVKRFLGNHIRQVGLFGLTVEFEASKRDLSRAVSDFAPALRNLLKELENEWKGLLLILDDLNGLTNKRAFAHWVKSLIDEIATAREPFPLTLVLVGLPERRWQLIENQPSLDRVFDLVSIERFSKEETREFYEKAFRKVGVSVTQEAHILFWRFSGGFPAFVHEIGDASYRKDTDNVIDQSDALQGVVAAAQVIGAKYIEPKVFAAIRSEKYMQILKKIPGATFEHQFSRKDVLSNLSEPQKKVFDNFIRRMRDLGVIRANREKGSGYYEFTSELYALFFWMQAAEAGRILP